MALLPLTGPQSEFGTSAKGGIEMAFEGSGIELKFEDHQGKPAQTATIFESLTASPPAAVIVFGSATSLAVAKKAQDRSIPMVSIATSDLIQKDKPYVFRHMLASDRSAKILVEEVNRLSLKQISTVATLHDGMLAFRNAFKSALAESAVGIATLEDVEVESSETDLRSIALSIMRKKPEGIFIGLMAPQASLFAKAIRGLGYKGELFASNQVDMPSEFKNGGQSFDGLWFSRDGQSRDNYFETKFELKFGFAPATFALNGFDVGKMIVEGLKKDQKAAGLVNHLTKLNDFKGVLGTYGVKPDRSFNVPGSLWIMANGVPQLKSR